jgi:predicted dehydrogenase
MPSFKTNRRDFLKKSLAGVAALGFPAIVPPSVFGRNGRVAPNNRINLAFIGLGNRGFRWDAPIGTLVRSFISFEDCHVSIACDVDRRYRDDTKGFVDQTYGNKDCEALNDFREILVRKDIDAVVVATPHHWHAEMTVLACQHGKDVYCEKPISNTVHQARAMVEAARRYGRIVQCGTQARSSSIITYACRAIQEGKIGNIRNIQIGISGGQPGSHYHLPAEPVPDYLDWDLFVGPAPWRPYNSQLRGAGHYFGGGTITDHGQHFFDVAQWGLGMDHSGPTEIYPPDGKTHEFLTYKYANGTEMNLRLRGDKGMIIGTTFIGTEGEIFVQAWEDRVDFIRPKELGDKYYQQAQLTSLRPEGIIANNHAYDFVNCIRTRKKPHADIEIGCRSVTVAHLANIGLWTNRPLRWDPIREDFRDDKDASRYLQTLPRAPWKV